MAENSQMAAGKEKPTGISQVARKTRGEAILEFLKPEGPKCMLCLERGHWTYECMSPRKHLVRVSRMEFFQKYSKKLETKCGCKSSNSQKANKRQIKKYIGNSGGCSSGNSQNSKKRLITKKKRNSGGCSRGSCKMSKKKDCSSSSESSISDDSSDSSDSDDDTSSAPTSNLN